MPDILVRDSLRNSVEAASNGKRTVLYTPKGQPSFMNIVPKANLEVLDPALSAATGITGVHPAFKIGDKTLSQLFIGSYPGVLSNGEFISIGNYKPYVFGAPGSSQWADARNAMNNMGGQWHLTNSIEYMLLMLQMKATGQTLLGNTYNGNWKMLGMAPDDVTQFGRRADGLPPGYTANDSGSFNYDRYNTQILSGSGPNSFRLGMEPTGISDLIGNGYTLTLGIRLVGNATDGFEAQIMGAGNEGAAAGSAAQFDPLYAGPGNWKAIDATTGALLTPTFTGALTANNTNSTYKPTTPNSVRFIASAVAGVTYPSNVNVMPSGNIKNGYTNSRLTFPAKVIALLNLYGFFPSNSDLATASTADNFGSAYPLDNQWILRGAYGPRYGQWVGRDGFTDLPRIFRPSYYNLTDLS